jgi:hypothetical protein
VIGVGVRDHDEIGLRDSGVIRLTSGIDMNDLASELEHHAPVKQGSELERTLRGFDNIGLPVGGGSAGGRRQADQKQPAHAYRLQAASAHDLDSIAVHEVESAGRMGY